MNKYFLTQGEKYFITKNKWIDFELINSLPSNEYIKETSATQKKKVEFQHNFGKTNSGLIIKEFAKIESLLIKKEYCNKTDFNDGYGKAFEVFTVAVLHNIPYEDVIEKYIVHGSDDGKIDAVYYDEHMKICRVFQMKLGYLDSDKAQMTSDNFANYLKFNTALHPNSQDFIDFMDKFEFKNQIAQSKKIQYVFVSTNSVSVRGLSFVIHTPNFIFETFINSLLTPPADNSVLLRIAADDSNISRVSEDEFFTYLSANSLILGLMEAVKNDEKKFNYLFRDNVRGKLTINKKIQETLKNEKDKFSKYNNGVSITGLVNHNGTFITVTNPSIVNGQQTIYSLKNAEDLNNVVVPVFFRGIKSETDKQKIAHYNNSQRKIKSIDLLSININVRRLQQDLLKLLDLKKNSYFLNIYNQGSTDYLKNARKLITKNKIIDLSSFLKLYYTLINPAEMGIWKNSFSTQLDKQMKTEITFELDKAEKVCESIATYNQQVQGLEKDRRNLVKSGDLPFMYILIKTNNKIDKANEAFDNLVYNNKDKVIKDVFRTKNIYDEVKKVLQKE